MALSGALALSGAWRDIRLAARQLWKAPGYTAAAVVTLALAIGANSAIFGAVQAVLLRPLPIERPGDVVIAWEADPAANHPVIEVSYRNFERWRAASTRSFSQMAVVGSSAWPAVLETPEAPVKLDATGVSADFFQTLGAQPMLGRLFRAEDDVPNAAPTVIVSHKLWRTHLNSDPAIVGKPLRLVDDPPGPPVIIIGVMPAAFDFPRGADLWIPVVPVLANASTNNKIDALEAIGVLFVLGRLREGVTPASAASQLDAIVRGIRAKAAASNNRTPGVQTQAQGQTQGQTQGQEQKNRASGAATAAGASSAVDASSSAAASTVAGPPVAIVTPLLDYMLGPVRHALWWLLGAVGVLLLIACANVSGLMLTRAAVRRREHAIRLALGATRGALGRLWAAESILIAAAGGILGLIASRWIAAAIVSLAPDDIPRLNEVSIDPTVAAFTFVTVLAAALLCGLGPVVQARAANLIEGLNDASRGTSSVRSVRARSTLVVLQITLAVVLLIGAGLVIRSFSALRHLDLGFDPTGTVTMELQPNELKQPHSQWMDAVLARIEQLPGVESAGSIRLRPFQLGAIGYDAQVIKPGQAQTLEEGEKNPSINVQLASVGYFRSMRIPLRRGRLFTPDDTIRAPRIVVISETAARRLFPGQEAVGQRLALVRLSSIGKPPDWLTVAGVVSDVRYRGLDDVRLDVYIPAAQRNEPAGVIVVRAAGGNPVTLAAAIQAEVRQVDPRVVIGGVTTMEAVVGREMAPWRFSTWLFGLFAALAFVLATVGLFGVVSLDVLHRSREFAVRLALGAQRRAISGRVLRSAAFRVVTGVVLGVAIAAVASRWMSSLLFGIRPFDPVTYGVVILMVAGVVAAASWLPARRAARIDPLTLLKRD
jgi:predicted permease